MSCKPEPTNPKDQPADKSHQTEQTAIPKTNPTGEGNKDAAR